MKNEPRQKENAYMRPNSGSPFDMKKYKRLDVVLLKP
jgi:hypothetical protein